MVMRLSVRFVDEPHGATKRSRRRRGGDVRGDTADGLPAEAAADVRCDHAHEIDGKPERARNLDARPVWSLGRDEQREGTVVGGDRERGPAFHR
jgi:hypothetical protein